MASPFLTKLPREIRNKIYHELWEETPLLWATPPFPLGIKNRYSCNLAMAYDGFVRAESMYVDMPLRTNNWLPIHMDSEPSGLQGKPKWIVKEETILPAPLMPTYVHPETGE